MIEWLQKKDDAISTRKQVYWKGREDLTEIIIIMAVSTNMNNVLDE